MRHLYRSLLLLLLYPCISYAADIVPTGSTAVEAGPNSVPIIQISAPNASGLSHNVFTEYNVGERGAVYNNYAGGDIDSWPTSELTGSKLLPNTHLSCPALVIFSEVTGSSATELLGPTEIYGSAADYILSNSRGIYCSGAGFINAKRVTLTTGVPSWDSRGFPSQFRVTSGLVRVLSGGLVGPTLDLGHRPIDIVCRAAQLSGRLWNPSSVNLYTGLNSYDYSSSSVTPLSEDPSFRPELAIDASLLGSIEAGKIQLISTESGVGVKAPSLLSLGEGIKVLSDGRITFNRVEASHGSFSATSTHGSLSCASAVLARDAISLSSPSAALAFTGSQLDSSSLSLRGASISIAPSSRLSVRGGSLSLHASHIQSAGILHASGPLTLVGTSLDHSGAMQAPSLSIQLSGAVTNTGSLLSQDHLCLSSSSLINHSGGHIEGGAGSNVLRVSSLQNAGTIKSLNDWTVASASLVNSGQFQANNKLSLTTDTLSSSGTLISKTLALKISDTLSHSGQLLGTSLKLSSATLENSGRIAGKTVSLSPTTRLTNNGTLVAQDALRLSTPLLANNASGTIQGGAKQNSMKIGHLSNKGTIKSLNSWSVSSDSLRNEGTFGAMEAFVVNSSTLVNTGTLGSSSLSVTLSSPFVHSGTLQGNKHLSIAAPSISNSGQLLSTGTLALSSPSVSFSKESQVKSSGRLSLSSTSIVNSGILSSASELATVSTSTLENNGRIAGKTVSLSPTTRLTNNGTLVAQDALRLSTPLLANNASGTIQGGSKQNSIKVSHLSNKGTIKSLNNWSVSSDSLRNEGTFGAMKALVVNSSTLVNTGTLGSSSLSVTLSSPFVHSGTLQGNRHLSIAAPSISNSGQLLSEGRLSLSSASIVNSGTLSSASELATVSTSTLENSGQIVGKMVSLSPAARLTNNGTLVAQDALRLSTPLLANNASGTIQGGAKQNSMKIGHLSNKGTIKSLNSWSVTSDALQNTGTFASDEDLYINAKSLSSTGKMGGGGVVSLSLARAFDHAGTLSSGTELSITAPSLVNRGKLSCVGALDIVTTTGDLVNKGDIVGDRSKGNIDVKGNIINEGTLYSQGNLYMNASGQLLNKSTLSSGGDLEIHSHTLDNQGGQKLTSGGELSIHLAGELRNGRKSELSSQGPMTLHVAEHKIINAGKLFAGDTLTLAAKSLRNKTEAAIFAKNNLTFTVSETLHNEEKGKIISHGDMLLQGAKGGHIKLAHNQVGELHALGSLTLKVVRLDNLGKVSGSYRTVTSYPDKEVGNYAEKHWKLISTSKEDSWFYAWDKGRSGPVHTRSFKPINFWLTERKEPVSEMTVSPGVIRAGGQLHLDILEEGENKGGIINSDMGGGLKITGAKLKNTDLPPKRVEISDAFVYEKNHTPYWSNDRHWRVFHESKTFTLYPSTSGLIEAGGDIELDVATFLNEAKKPANAGHSQGQLAALKADGGLDPLDYVALPGSNDCFFERTSDVDTAALPTPTVDSSLFTNPRQAPSAGLALTAPTLAASLPASPISFLYRTAVKMDQSAFFGSPYFLRKLGLLQIKDKSKFHFLGDPFYESRLINTMIYRTTNQLYLRDDLSDPAAQVKYLIDNAALVQKDLHLAVGVSLSQAQQKKLKHDIIWYVEKEIDGQKVLAPRLYLCQATRDSLDKNSGPKVRSRRGRLTITGDQAKNMGGTLYGKKALTVNTENSFHSEGVGGRRAQVKTDGDISIKSDNLTLLGSAVGAGGNIDLVAKKDLKTGTVETKTEHTKRDPVEANEENGWVSSSFSNKEHTEQKTETRQLSTEIVAGNKVTTKSGGDTSIVGTNIEADELSMDADGKMALLVAYDSNDTEEKDVQEEVEKRLLGLVKERKKTTTTKRHGNKKAMGNQIKVRKAHIHGKKEVLTEAIQLSSPDGGLPDELTIHSSEGKQIDRAAQETEYNNGGKAVEESNHGLFLVSSSKLQGDDDYAGWAKDKEEKGRVLGLKLWESNRYTTSHKSKQSTPKRSTIQAKSVHIGSDQATADISAATIIGEDVVVKGVKDIALSSTQATHEVKTLEKNAQQESSIGVQNKFLEAFKIGSEAFDTVSEALKNTALYNEYAAGDISQQTFMQRVGENFEQGGALGLAAANALADTKHATDKAAEGASSVALGFRVGAQHDEAHTSTEATSNASRDVGAVIVAKRIKLISEQGKVNIDSAQVVASEELSIKSKGLKINSGKNTLKTTENVLRVNGNIAAETDPIALLYGIPNASGNVHGSFQYINGHRDKTGYDGALLQAPNVHLDIDGDVHNKGGKILGNVQGTITGDVHQEDLQNIIDGARISGVVHGSVSAAVVGNTNSCSAQGGAQVRYEHEEGRGISDADLATEFPDPDPKKQSKKLKELENDFTAQSAYAVINGLNGPHLKVLGKITHDKKRENHYKKVAGGTQGSIALSGDDLVKIANDGVGSFVDKDLAARHLSGGVSYERRALKSTTAVDEATGEAIKTTVTFKNQVGSKLDKRTIEVLRNPMETAQDIVDDVHVVRSAGEGIAEAVAVQLTRHPVEEDTALEGSQPDENPSSPQEKESGLGMTGFLSAIQESCQEAAGIIQEDAKDEQLRDVINHPENYTAEQYEEAAKTLFQNRQRRDGVHEEDLSDLLVYQGSTDEFENSELQGYRSAHDAENKKMYLNTDSVGLSQGGNTVKATGHEAGRKKIASSDRMKQNMSSGQQTRYADLSGKRARRIWNRQTGARRVRDYAAEAKFNNKNRDFISGNHSEVARHGELKPWAVERYMRGRLENQLRALEELKKTPEHQALEKKIEKAREDGDSERLNTLKAEKQQIESEARLKANGDDIAYAFLEGAAKGFFVDGVGSMAELAHLIATDPIAAAEGLASAVQQIPGVLADLPNLPAKLSAEFEEIGKLPPEEQAEAIGRALGNLGFALVPVTAVAGGAAKALKVTRIVKGAGGIKTSTRILNATTKQLQAKFKHAVNFGVTGNWNKAAADRFKSAINQQINSAGVKAINGTYRGQSVIHYVNPNTGLNVISSPSGQFISGWKLNSTQLQNVLKHGGL